MVGGLGVCRGGGVAPKTMLSVRVCHPTPPSEDLSQRQCTLSDNGSILSTNPFKGIAQKACEGLRVGPDWL